MTAGGASQRWSPEKPKEAGWYWFKRTDLPAHCRRSAVLEVCSIKGGLKVHEDYGDGVLWHPVKQYNGLWCGPLEPPHDQEAG
jgi:hypothetical protein